MQGRGEEEGEEGLGTPTLRDWLEGRCGTVPVGEGAGEGRQMQQHEYALAMSPGFFQFFNLCGVLEAMDDAACRDEEGKLLHGMTHCSGSSAGALVLGSYASGVEPHAMREFLLELCMEDFWDMGGVGGLLRGRKFHDLLLRTLEAHSFEDCRVPFGAGACSVTGLFETKRLDSGCLPTAIRASCCFPGLFQPVWVDGALCIDGGVWDDAGVLALPGLPRSNRLVNIVSGAPRIRSSHVPQHVGNENTQLLTVAMEGLPQVTPFSLETGHVANRRAYKAFRRALDQRLERVLDGNKHAQWSIVVDASAIDELVSEPRTHSQQQQPQHQQPQQLRSQREQLAAELEEERAKEEAAAATGAAARGEGASSSRRRKREHNQVRK